MSGRQTFRSQHNFCVYCEPHILTIAQVKELSRLLDRELTPIELSAIASRCGEIRAWADLIASERPTNQDIFKTLAAIAKAEPTVAMAMYRAADGWTQAEIYTSAYFDVDAEQFREGSVARCRVELWNDRSNIIPEVVSCAAGLAINRLQNKEPKDGRRVAIGQQELACFAVSAWKEMGGKGVAWKNNLTASSLMLWARVIFEITFNRAPDNRELQSLLKGQRRQKKR